MLRSFFFQNSFFYLFVRINEFISFFPYCTLYQAVGQKNYFPSYILKWNSPLFIIILCKTYPGREIFYYYNHSTSLLTPLFPLY